MRSGFWVDKGVPIEFIPEAISDFDIGVMPLIDCLLENGNCAIKALKYMLMGIPTIVVQ